MAEYNKLKSELERLEFEDKKNQDMVKEIRAYVYTLKKSNIISEFKDELFAMLVDKVIVYESGLKIRWRDGREK